MDYSKESVEKYSKEELNKLVEDGVLKKEHTVTAVTKARRILIDVKLRNHKSEIVAAYRYSRSYDQRGKLNKGVERDVWQIMTSKKLVII